MSKGKRNGLLIAGGGLAGCLAALAMAKRRPDVPLLLVEEGERFGGDQFWSFLDGTVAEAHRWLVAPLLSHAWDGFYVAAPDGSRRLKAGYRGFSSTDLDRAVRETLRPDQYRLGTRIVAVRDDTLVLGGGERITADGALDARGAANLSLLDLGWKTTAGRLYRFREPHGLDRPVAIDVTVDQSAGCRFLSCLPFSERRMRVEDTRLEEAAELDREAAAARLDSYVARRQWKPAAVEAEDGRTLPIVLGGDFGAFWRVGGARVAKLGLRGGFFHPSTGATLADAAANAVLLAEQRNFSGAALHDRFERQAALLWKKRTFYRAFNRLLFAAAPGERHRLLERPYRRGSRLALDFHAGRLGMIERRRLLNERA